MKRKCRFQIPFNIKCKNCKDVLPEGKRIYCFKHTSKETFHGLKIFILSIRCYGCGFYYKLITDPQFEEYKPLRGCNKVLLNLEEVLSESEISITSAKIATRIDIKIVKKAFKENKTIQQINREFL
ncbi:hypothetical protein A0H76_2351 [Hepatospora eriocheir]|uniref:Uncharacterized protein n=1 Tax=Hepatospora eriocheir TaxID=1081669 RepID=A0A1X0QFI2_9MICR|nr:hypothetical protein A0H76_2351 [Hepatospora eriocheir]